MSDVGIESQIDSVCTQRHGPLSSIIRRIASNKLSEAKPDMDAYLHSRATGRLEQAMTEVSTDVVEELNEANQLDEMIVEHFPEAKSWKYHLAATDQVLTAAVGPTDATIPSLRTNADGTLPVSMEVWIKTTWKESLLLKAALTWSSTQDLLEDVLPAEFAKLIADDVTLSTDGDWFVISVGHKAITKTIDALEQSDSP